MKQRKVFGVIDIRILRWLKGYTIKGHAKWTGNFFKCASFDVKEANKICKEDVHFKKIDISEFA